MRHAALLLYGVLTGVCGACASLPPPQINDLFDDTLFGPPSQHIVAKQVASEVMALSPEMKRYILEEIEPSSARKDVRRVLVDALYNQRELRLDYEGGATRTASEAFRGRAGNCLSLVLMTAAFARELGIPVQYQSVVVEDAWSREGNLFFASGHVNLTLGALATRTDHGADRSQNLTIDFLPAEQIRGQRVRVISERTILAMFMNNRAAEALANGALNDAYAWTRAAIEQDPAFYDAHNTLGVVYLRSGHAARAERVLANVLYREPANTKVMANMVRVLERLGRQEQAQALSLELAQLLPIKPFQFFDAGLDAMLHGNYRQARELFSREVARDSSYHEFHFWLALANYGLGDVEGTREHLTLARDFSPTRRQQSLYVAKLDRLQSDLHGKASH